MADETPELFWWRITFRPSPSTVPAAHRVRKLLKYALKQGLVNVKQEQVKPGEGAGSGPAA